MTSLPKPTKTPKKPKKPVKSKRTLGARRREVKAAGTVTEDQLEAILVAFDRLCAYCRRYVAKEWDHYEPISRGGKHEAANLVPSCSACNISKGTRAWPMPKGHPFA